MNDTLFDTTCPECKHRFPIAADEMVVCPCCAWEFGCDVEGNIEEDDGDRESPFEMDAEGELDSSGLTTVHCPHCVRPLEIEAGQEYVRCPGCRHLGRLVPARLEPEDGPPQGWWTMEDEYGPQDEEEEEDDEELGEGHGAVCPRCNRGLRGVLTYGWLPAVGSRISCRNCGDQLDWRHIARRLYPDHWTAYTRALAEDGTVNRRVPERDAPVARVVADGSGNYTTIAEALRAPRWNGRTIRIAPGTYREDLALDSPNHGPLTLLADGPPSSVRIETSAGVQITASKPNVFLRGLTFVATDASPAVHVAGGLVFFTGCTFIGDGSACLAAEGPMATPFLRGCRFAGNAQTGVLAARCALPTLVGCEFGGGLLRGALGSEGGRLDLRRCRLRDLRGEGVFVGIDGTARIADTTFEGIGRAAIGGRAARLFVEGCTLRNGRSAGVRIVGGFALLNRCTVEGCGGPAVSARSDSGLLLRYCDLHEGGAAVVRLRGRARALLDDCTLAAPTRPGLVVGDRARARLRRCELNLQGSVLARLGRDSQLALVRCVRR